MPIKSHKLGPGSLAIGEVAAPTEFASQLRSCSVTPSTEEEDAIPVLSGEELAGDETYTWTLGGALLDDYSGTTSLNAWCFTNRGEELPFEFIPNSDAGLKVSGTVKVRPMALGGDVKTRNENDFEFKIVGDPVFAAIA